MTEQQRKRPAEMILMAASDTPVALVDALAGVRLSGPDLKVVEWMRRQGEPNVAALVSVLEKVRQVGYAEGYKDAREDQEPRPAGRFPDPTIEPS